MNALRGLGALLVVAAASAAARPAPAQVPTPAADEKVVVITVVNGTVTVDQDPIRIRVGKDTVHWYCADADPTIAFDHGHPFAAEIKHDGRHVRSKAALKGKEGKTYHYAITLKLKSGDTAILDPAVEVMP